jgi:hypothetical protein
MLPGEEMKTIRWAWLLLRIPPLLAARPAVPASPNPDMVEVVSTTPPSDSESVPELLARHRMKDGLQGARELVCGSVPEAASSELETLFDELRRLKAGDGPAEPLPTSYRNDGELWLPVRAQSLRVRLDAPDLRRRQDLTPTLRKQIVLAAEPHQAEGHP